VQGQVGDQALEAGVLGLPLLEALWLVLLESAVLVAPAVPGRLADAAALAELGDGQAPGPISLGLAPLGRDLFGRVSLHDSSPGPAGPQRLSYDLDQFLGSRPAKAASLGIAYNIALVDAGGHLVAFVRQDGALIGSIDLAIDKAVTARIFNKATSDLASLAQPGKPLFGIQESNAGKGVIFGGGIPVVFDGSIVGAVGASAGTVEQDIAVAEAAIAALVAKD